jgi:hypothetical protein
MGVNDRGDVVGSVSNCAGASRIALWRDGTFFDLGPISRAALAENGDVVFNDATLGPVVWRDGVLTPILTEPFPPGTAAGPVGMLDGHRVAYGRYGLYPNGPLAAFVLPTPELLLKWLMDSPLVQRLPARAQLVQKALDKLIGGQTNVACNHLHAFSNQVRAQSGKRLTVVEADQVLADVARASAAMGCR